MTEKERDRKVAEPCDRLNCAAVSSTCWHQYPPAPTQRHLYPKLQLVQIDNVCYALNQSCLQIYQMLQQKGQTSLMQVDIVPLSKVSPSSPAPSVPKTFLSGHS